MNSEENFSAAAAGFSSPWLETGASKPELLEKLMEWGKSHHYPQLLLSKKDVLRHGRQEWDAMLRGTEERIERAIERVRRWQAREGQTDENH